MAAVAEYGIDRGVTTGYCEYRATYSGGTWSSTKPEYEPESKCIIFDHNNAIILFRCEYISNRGIILGSNGDNPFHAAITLYKPWN